MTKHIGTICNSAGISGKRKNGKTSVLQEGTKAGFHPLSVPKNEILALVPLQ